jgi:hypothetical protein
MEYPDAEEFHKSILKDNRGKSGRPKLRKKTVNAI